MVLKPDKSYLIIAMIIEVKHINPEVIEQL